MTKRKVVKPIKPITHEIYSPPESKWYWFVRKRGFLQPVPYKYKSPDLKPLIEYAENITKSD